MKRMLGYLRTGLFGLAVVGALGFGTSYAVAAGEEPPAAARSCGECSKGCPPEFGGMIWNGTCACCG